MLGLEATALKLITPDQLVAFRYNNQNRVFIPTRLELDITEGKTQFIIKEALLQILTDISYE